MGQSSSITLLFLQASVPGTLQGTLADPELKVGSISIKWMWLINLN